MSRLKKLLAKEQSKSAFHPLRFRLICLGVFGCLMVLLAWVGDLQLINHPMLEKEADERSLRTVTLPTNRGTLLDRNGEALALSVPSRDIIADPLRVLEAHPDFTSAKWEYLANALDQRPEQIAQQINQNPKRRFLYLGRKIELGIAKDISQLHLAGITTVYDDSRFYPMSDATGPLLGIVGADNTGLTGLEKGFDKVLQGTPGVEKYRQDAHGNIVAMINYEPPRQPPTVQLSIDKFDQYTLYSKLRDGVLLNKADSGAAVLIKIDTGEILGMASYPSFNPNNFVNVSANQMRNTAINDSYEPGSTVKPLVVMEGLVRKLVRPDSVLDTTPYRVNGHLIRDVGHWPRLTMTGILQKSSMPEIVVERYNTGRFGTNATCDQVYLRALERVGQQESGNIGLPSQASGAMSQEQLQAVGQAVTARSNGGNLSISRQGSGAKKEPLYVVVDESLGSTIFKWVKFLLMFGFACYMSLVLLTLFIDATGIMKKVGGSQNQEAKPELQKTRFTDVHGCDEAKEELQELVEFLKAPDKFSTLGGKLPKGVLLVGPPGTGKTLLARAVAGEAGVPFFYMSGSEFDEVYVGVGAKRVRDLFTAARAKSPAIIFIDELDAIGSKRHERDAAYAKQTLNQLLTELDGFDQDTGVIIIGATNFPQSLDKALTRPGRFDRNVVVGLPDVRGRISILQHHLKSIRVDGEVDASVLARGTPGFSGAELENIVNQAAVRASKNKAKTVAMEDLTWAKDKVLMGAERRSAVIQQKDKVMTAYHEGGHALVAMLTKETTPLYKATIMPRGHALGLTQMLPELDKVSETKKEMMAQIDVCMGGKVAEELIYGPENVTTGASSDIQSATRIAHMMVTQAGMSDKLGNIDLNSDYARLSSETKQMIESEVRRLVEEGRERARLLLTNNREQLERLANALVEYETLDKEEMEAAVRGEKLNPKKPRANKDSPVKVPEIPLPPQFGVPSPPGLGGTGVAGGPKPPGGVPGGRAGEDDGPRPYPTGSP